ncbi:hypothetical protein AB834_05630 [PVC group bacterium (ex Bugula neritina AB1)]|nr:hypothetical protein AB834_05630 [PVC group bacterium (ex Bugula neritina AB1)]
MLIKNKVKILLHFFVQIFFIHSCFNFAFPLAPQPSYNKPPLSSLEDTPTSSPDQKLPIQNNSDIKNNKQKRYKLLAIIKYTPLAFAILTSMFAILFFLDIFSLENPLEKALIQSFLAISFAINTIASALILCFFYKIPHIDSSSRKDFKRELYLAAALVIITVAIFIIYLLLELMPNLEKDTIPVPFVAQLALYLLLSVLFY